MLTKNCITEYNKTRHNPYIKTGQGNPVGGRESQEQAKESETPCPHSYCLEFHNSTKLNDHNVYAEDLTETHTGSVIAIPVSVSPMSPAWYCKLCSSGFLYPSDSCHPSFLSSTGFPQFLLFCCGSLHLFPVVARWSFFWTRYKSMNIAKYPIFIRIISLTFFQYFFILSWTLGYLASGSLPSKQCQAWASSHGVGL